MAKTQGKGKGKSLNPFDSPAIGIVMKQPVRPKRNNTKPIVVRDVIARTVNNKIPEVLVKIKRGGKSANHVMAHLEYITRNGKLDGETERGEIIQGKTALKEVLKEWTSDADNVGSIRSGQRNTINAIFSMPPGTDPEGVKDAVRSFAKQELSNYQYLFVLHTDDDHPHCHVSIKTLGFDGKKLDPRKDDLQHWREVFAEKLREQKIPAKATPRTTRGIIEKSPSMAQYKAAHDRKDERGHRTYEARVRAAAATLNGEDVPWVSGKPKKADPWGQQKEIRESWQAIAADLRETGDADDKALAQEIVRFVQAMPPIHTQQERIAEQIGALRNQARAPQQVPVVPEQPAMNRDNGNEGRER